MRKAVKTVKRIIAVMMAFLMIFENPATTLAADDTVIAVGESSVSDNEISIPYDNEGTVSDDILETEDALEASVTEEELLIDDGSTDITISENSVSENIMEEEPDEGYFEESSDEEYDIPTVSDNALLYEIPELRDENVKVYERADRSHTAYYYPEAVNYLNEEGHWNTIDNRLHFEEAEDGVEGDYNGYTNNAAAFDVCFAETADEDSLFTVSRGEHKASFVFIPDGRMSEASTTDDGSDDNELLAEGTGISEAVSDNALLTAESASGLSGNSVSQNAYNEDKEAEEEKIPKSWKRDIKLIDSDDGTAFDDKKSFDPSEPEADRDDIALEGISGSEDDDIYKDASDVPADDMNAQEDDCLPQLPKPQTVIYEDIEEDASLEYRLEGDGVKETVIADSPDAPSSYYFGMELQGMNACLEEGGVILSDEDGNSIFTIPAPEVTDAAGIADENACYTLKNTGDNRYELGIHADKEWFKSDERVFPVRLDPTIVIYRQYESLAGLGDFVCIGSNGSKNRKEFKVGRENKKNKKNKKKTKVVYRTYMNPRLPKIEQGSVVTSAKMRLTAGEASKLFYVIPVPDKWSIDSINSGNQPFKSMSLKKSLKKKTDFGKNGDVIIDVTRDVRDIYAGNRGSYGWCFVSEDEGTADVRTISPSKGKDKPFLEVTYRDHTGSEDYYSAHGVYAGNAGYGSINDYSGRLSLSHLDATSKGERMTLSISHIYDMAYGQRKGEERWQTADGQKSAYGEHFKLSTDVRLLTPAGETSVKKWPYVYIDSDGTKHYFKKADVSYYVNGEKKTIENNGDETYPSAKDEDGLGLFVVPVKEKTLKKTYPLKIVNKSGSTSMYFDKSGYLWKVCDSNLREDNSNNKKKKENAVKITYENESFDSAAELARLKEITDQIKAVYGKNATKSAMIEKALSGISEIEAFESESVVLSARYPVALHVQKAREQLEKLPNGAAKAEFKDDVDNAVKQLKAAMDEDFNVSIKYPVKVTDAAGISSELTYDSAGRLLSMSDPYEGGALISYSYDAGGRLVKITHPDGTYASYKYDGYGHLTEASDETGHRIKYSYAGTGSGYGDQVVKYTEYFGKKAGQSVLIGYEGSNTTIYTFSGRDDKTGTKDDIENIYCFDNKGRAISAYSRKKSNGEVIGGAVRAFTGDEGSSQNKVKEEAITGAQVINLLNDGSFEKAKSKKGAEAWSVVNTCTKSGKCHTVTKDETKKYMGTKAAHLKLSDKSGHNGRIGYSQSVTVPESGTYTASVYVRTKDLKDAHVKLRAYTSKKAAESTDDKESEEESTLESGDGADDTDDEDDEDDEESGDESEETISDDMQLSSADGFKRIEISIKAKKGKKVTVELSLTGKSGEAWFDCAQLEKGSLANQYNMLPSSGFEDGFKLNPSLPALPSGWAYGVQPVKKGEKNTDDESLFPDEDDEEETGESPDEACVRIVDPKDHGFKAISGKKVLKITGNPIKKRSVIINPNFGKDNASYTFSCYVKADCAPIKGKRKCGIYIGGDAASYLEDNASGKYVCKTKDFVRCASINTAVPGWQYVSLSLPVKNWYGKVIEIRFDYECGALYLDDCMLTKNDVKIKTYTSSGKLKTERKGERSTKYEIDARGREKKVTNPGGSTVKYKYDKVTNDVKSKKYSFKQPGNKEADTLAVSYEYDTYGNVIKDSGKSSGIDQTIVHGTVYDDQGRFVIKDTDSAGNATSLRFDEHTGQLLSEEDASGVTESYTYDTYDNLTGVMRDGEASAYVYDAKKHDLLTKINVGDGDAKDTISYKYDAYGNVKSVTRLGKDKKLVSYKYNPKEGKLKKTVYGNGDKVTYAYNDAEQLISEKYGKKDIIRYEYDNRGNTARVTDEKNHLKYRYYYDEHARVTNASVHDFSNGKNSEVVSFANVYDKAGRQSVFAYYTGGRAFRTEYGYTSDDKLSSAKLPSGGMYKTTYDGFDRVKSEKFEPQKQPQTGEKKARGNGATVTTSYGYLDTDRGNPKGKTVKNNKTTYKYTTDLLNKYVTTIEKNKKKTTVVSNTIKYDELNRIADFDGTVYSYDTLGRLVRAEDQKNKRSWEYTYDALGNITSCIYTDNGTVSEEKYSYDRQNLVRFDGVKVSGYKGGNPKNYLGNTLKWERGRQLKSVTPKKGKYAVTAKAEYTYAGDGSRLSKTVGRTKKNKGIRTDYILNGSLILAERHAGNGADVPEETLNYYYSSEGRLLEIGYCTGNEKERHYSVIRNALGDVVALYTAEGILVGTYEYDPYGKLISETPNASYEDKDGILVKNPFRYRGYYYDNETGWYYLQSRYYDPTVRRFINADTPDLLTNDCDNLMQYNLFMYCNGDPVNGIDPSGHIDFMDFYFTLMSIQAIISGNTLPTESNSEGGARMATATGVSASFTMGFVYLASLQLYKDQYGNAALQFTCGDGIGGGAGLTIGPFEAIYPHVQSIKETEKFGVITGGSGGYLGELGADMLFGGEGDDLHPIGGSVGAYGGAGAEGHVIMGYTHTIFRINLFEKINRLNKYLRRKQ